MGYLTGEGVGVGGLVKCDVPERFLISIICASINQERYWSLLCVQAILDQKTYNTDSAYFYFVCILKHSASHHFHVWSAWG